MYEKLYSECLKLEIRQESKLAILTVRTFVPRILKHFGYDSYRFMEASFKEIKEKDVSTLIIDLRWNDGGELLYCKDPLAYLIDEPFEFANLESTSKQRYPFLEYTDKGLYSNYFHPELWTRENRGRYVLKDDLGKIDPAGIETNGGVAMNKGMLIFVAMVACILMSIGSCGKTRHVLDKGGFEPLSALQKSPADWYATELPHTREFVSFEWDDQVVHSGKRSVSIAIAASHPDEVIAYNWTKVVPGCQVGKSYELSGWVRAQNLSGPAWIVVQCWNDARSEMLGFATTQKDYPITGTSDWTQVGTVFTVPAGTAEVRIRAGIATPENRGGRVWFDDLCVRELR